MSTAALVPETWQLSGDDAWDTLRQTGRLRLLGDAFQRLRLADGFSHARSLAFMMSLTMVQGIIAVVGLATAVGNSDVTDIIVRTIKGAVPGPAGQALTAATAQAQHAGASRQYVAVILGTIGSLISGTTAIGQLERGLNRLYGVEQDRPTIRKYGLAFLMALTAGTLVTVALICIAFGRQFGTSVHNAAFDGVWGYARWPLGLVLMVAAVGLLFRWCPRRRQPAWSWMAFGSFVAVALWLVVTVALGVVFRLSSSFGETYGPLAGIIALLLWALFSAVTVLYGAAVSAQLEGVRARIPGPQDAEKAAYSEPAGDGRSRAPRTPASGLRSPAVR